MIKGKRVNVCLVVQDKANGTHPQKRALRALKANEALTILLADKGNATMILKTADCIQKIYTLLEDKADRKLKEDPTESMEHNSVLLLKDSLLAEEVCQHLRPQGSRPLRLYGLPKAREYGVPLRTIVSPTCLLAKYLAGLLGTHTGNTLHHMKNSTDFVITLDSLQFGPHDVIVIFGVVALLTKVPIKERMDLLVRHFEEDIPRLFFHVLMTSYFSFLGQFYEQVDSMAMVSQFSPVIAKFYKENFEDKTLNQAPHKPLCWFRHMDNTFVIRPHGPDRLKDFLNHLNSIHQCIQFIITN
jgi:hypothetical protein